MSTGTVGFIGLGNMGGALAANLVAAGHHVVAHDARGPETAPQGSAHVTSAAEVARLAGVVVLSLPDGKASEQVARELAATPERAVEGVIDTSTIGVPASWDVGVLLGDVGIDYVDAPVSGGVGGARARTLTVMYAGSDGACARVGTVLEGLSDRRWRVGERPGMAQAMKLANNFLAATTLAATSEAVSFGLSAGLDMATMVEVLDASSGRSGATDEKFPNQIVTGRYAGGFTNSLMAKDVRLYLDGAGDRGVIGAATGTLWQRFADADPDADTTRMYPFVAQDWQE